MTECPVHLYQLQNWHTYHLWSDIDLSRVIERPGIIFPSTRSMFFDSLFHQDHILLTILPSTRFMFFDSLLHQGNYFSQTARNYGRLVVTSVGALRWLHC
ncbi:hypothetical protein VPH35_043744 [Triticum aestivum]